MHHKIKQIFNNNGRLRGMISKSKHLEGQTGSEAELWILTGSARFPPWGRVQLSEVHCSPLMLPPPHRMFHTEPRQAPGTLHSWSDPPHPGFVPRGTPTRAPSGAPPQQLPPQQGGWGSWRGTSLTGSSAWRLHLWCGTLCCPSRPTLSSLNPGPKHCACPAPHARNMGSQRLSLASPAGSFPADGCWTPPPLHGSPSLASLS